MAEHGCVEPSEALLRRKRPVLMSSLLVDFFVPPSIPFHLMRAVARGVAEGPRAVSAPMVRLALMIERVELRRMPLSAWRLV